MEWGRAASVWRQLAAKLESKHVSAAENRLRSKSVCIVSATVVMKYHEQCYRSVVLTEHYPGNI